MGTLTIPLTTLPTGDTVFGPVTVASTITQAQATIDRTVAGGMNSNTSATTITYRHEFSTDGGTTFPYVGRAGPFPGGTILDPDTGQPVTADGFGVSLPPQAGATQRQARLRTTVVGGPVAVSGTLITS